MDNFYLTQKIEYKKNIKKLLIFNIEVSYLCNLNCPYCYNPSHKDLGCSYKEKIEIYDKILNLKENIHLVIIGGEPSLSKEALYIWKKFDKKRSDLDRLSLFTNGLGPESFYENLITTHKDSIVLFSWHNDALKDKKNYQQFFKNLNIIKENNTKFGVCMTLGLDDNDWDEKKEILKKIKAMGGYTQVEFIFLKNKKYNSDKIEEYEKFKEFFHSNTDNCKIKKIIIQNKNRTIMQFKYEEYDKFFPNGFYGKKICYNNHYNIDPYLNISFSCDFSKKANLKKVNLEDFIENNKVLCDINCLDRSDIINKKILLDKNLIKEIYAKANNLQN